jgi:hypothetical protein
MDSTWFALDFTQFDGAAALFRPRAMVETVPVTVTMDGGVVELFGRVLDATGAGIPGQALEFAYRSPQDEAYVLRPGTTTDDQGYYRAMLPARDGYGLRAWVIARDGTRSAGTPKHALRSDSFAIRLPDLE